MTEYIPHFFLIVFGITVVSATLKRETFREIAWEAGKLFVLISLAGLAIAAFLYVLPRPEAVFGGVGL